MDKSRRRPRRDASDRVSNHLEILLLPPVDGEWVGDELVGSTVSGGDLARGNFNLPGERSLILAAAEAVVDDESNDFIIALNSSQACVRLWLREQCAR